jgi:hypothetical protein
MLGVPYPHFDHLIHAITFILQYLEKFFIILDDMVDLITSTNVSNIDKLANTRVNIHIRINDRHFNQHKF